MTTSRAQAPPVNLKERIAALQQRNVSPGPRPTSPSAPSPSAPNSAGLRDKIAKFEKKGGVPVPRGSFGLGAPPLAENGPAKRRGELYGNRIPGAVRASGGVSTVSRSSSPFDSPRSFSMSALEGDDVDLSPTDAANYLPSSPSSPDSPATSFQNLTPQHTGTKERGPAPRGMPFATALEHARRVEGNLETSLKPAARESSPSTIPPPSALKTGQAEAESDHDAHPSLESSTLPEEPLSDQPTQPEVPETEVPLPSPPSIVLSPSSEPEPKKVVAETVLPSKSASRVETPSAEPLAPSKAPETVNALSIDNTDTTDTKVATTEGQSLDSSTTSAKADNSSSLKAATEKEVVPVSALGSTPTSTSACSTPVNVASEKSDGAAGAREEPPASPAATSPSDPSPLSPMGPFTLANAVHDLGQVVANIHDMFPGQISPLAAPPPYRSFRVETPSQDQATPQEPKTPVKAKKSAPDLQIPPHPASAAPVPPSAFRPEATTSAVRSNTLPPEAQVAAEKANHLTAPRTANARPISLVETSPSHLAVAHRVTPVTSRGVPVFLPANGQQQKNFEHFPPTPEPNETEFGTVSLHKPSHSFSHARAYVAHGQTAEQDGDAAGKPTFTAVVHRKVTELPPSSSSTSYKDFYKKVPETPQPKRTQSSGMGETPLSPGYGELATLLHEAALLELTLEQGELPTEAMRKEEAERKQKEQEAKEQKKEAAARAKVEEEKRKHEAVAKARAKQEASESKSRSSFRNPLLRSKSSHKREMSTDSEASEGFSRSKSLLLPFRPQPTPPPTTRQSNSAITSIPEKEVAPEPTADADTSSQTSPKSPRQYLAGLRRLASSSRSSTTSATHSRNSVSASSEMSSEDSLSIPTPPGNGLDSGSAEATVESGGGGIWNGSGITWPSLSPKKSPSMGRAASFADKMWNRGRTKSNISTNSPYETIDRLTRSRAAKSAAALIPPLDPVSFSIEVPALQEGDLPSPPEELVSPRRSASVYVASTSQFPPVYSARPTSSVYTPLPAASGASQPLGLDSLFSEKLKSPVFTPHPGQRPEGTTNLDSLFTVKPTSPVYTPHLAAHPQETQNLDALFSGKPTSSVYTPRLPAMRSEETITEPLMTSPRAESLLPSPQIPNSRPESWISDTSMDSSTSSIPSPFFDSFPSVPEEMPLPPALPGRQRNFNRPSLPLPTPSFFEPAPISSAAVGAEFFSAPARSATVKSVTLTRVSGEHRR